MKSTNPVWMEAIKGQKNGNNVVTWVKKEWIQKTLFLLCGIDLGEHSRNWLWWAPVERGTVEFRGGDAESQHSIFLNLGLYDLLLSWPNKWALGWPKRWCGFFSPILWGNPNQCFGQPNTYLKIENIYVSYFQDTAVINWLHIFLLSY